MKGNFGIDPHSVYICTFGLLASYFESLVVLVLKELNMLSSAVDNIPVVVKSKGVTYDTPDEEARSCAFDEKLEEKSDPSADSVEALSSPRDASRLQSDSVQPFHCIHSDESSFSLPATTG